MTPREHFESLAAEIGATVIHDVVRYRAYVNLRSREIHLAQWDDVPESELYWTALHELGHLAIFDADGLSEKWLYPFEEADDEARAWVWAIEHSIFPFDQAAESSIAWGIADRIFASGFRPSPALETIFEKLGPEPDWFFNVTEPLHWKKLDGYARPAWAELAAVYGSVTA